MAVAIAPAAPCTIEVTGASRPEEDFYVGTYTELADAKGTFLRKDATARVRYDGPSQSLQGRKSRCFSLFFHPLSGW